MLAADDEEPKWTKHYDTNHNYYYYVNEITGESFWEGTEGAPSFSNQDQHENNEQDNNNNYDNNNTDEEEESFLISNSITSTSNNNIYSAHGRTLIDTLEDMRSYDKSIQWHAVLIEAPLCFIECYIRIFIALVLALYCSIFWLIAYIHSIYSLTKRNRNNSNTSNGIRLIMKQLALGWLREIPICIATSITLFVLPFVARFAYSCFKPSGYGKWYLQPLPTLIGWVDARRFCTFVYGSGRSATDPDLDLLSYHTSNRSRSSSRNSSNNSDIDDTDDELREEMFERGIPDEEIEDIIRNVKEQPSFPPPLSSSLSLPRHANVQESEESQLPRLPQAQGEDKWVAPPIMEFTLLELFFYFWMFSPIVWIFLQMENRYANTRTTWIRKMEDINNKPLCGSYNDNLPGTIAIFPKRLFKICEILINKRICNIINMNGNRFMQQNMTNEGPFITQSIGIELDLRGENTGMGGSVKEMRHAAAITRGKAWDYDSNQLSSTVSSFINNTISGSSSSSSSSSSRDDDGVELRDASFIESPLHQSMISSSSNVGIVRMRYKNNSNSSSNSSNNGPSLYSDDDDEKDDDEFYEGVGEDIGLLK